MKIAAQTVDVVDIICKVLTKVFPENPTWNVETYNEYCTLIEETLICLKTKLIDDILMVINEWRILIWNLLSMYVFFFMLIQT